MNAAAWAILFGVAFVATLGLYLLTGMRLREMEEERKALRDVDHGNCEEYEERLRADLDEAVRQNEGLRKKIPHYDVPGFVPRAAEPRWRRLHSVDGGAS